jgi:hypothetical protein
MNGRLMLSLIDDVPELTVVKFNVIFGRLFLVHDFCLLDFEFICELLPPLFKKTVHYLNVYY